MPKRSSLGSKGECPTHILLESATRLGFAPRAIYLKYPTAQIARPNYESLPSDPASWAISLKHVDDLSDLTSAHDAERQEEKECRFRYALKSG